MTWVNELPELCCTANDIPAKIVFTHFKIFQFFNIKMKFKFFVFKRKKSYSPHFYFKLNKPLYILYSSFYFKLNKPLYILYSSFYFKLNKPLYILYCSFYFKLLVRVGETARHTLNIKSLLFLPLLLTLFR